MKIWNFINGWHLRRTRVNRVIVMFAISMSLNQLIYASQQEPPSLEFLEFLGEGVMVEEEYLDPLNYNEIDNQSSTEPESGSDTDDVVKDEK